MGSIIIEQSGKDCIVTMGGVTHTIENCDAIKLANSIWDRPGEKYSKEEMFNLGFEPKFNGRDEKNDEPDT